MKESLSTIKRRIVATDIKIAYICLLLTMVILFNIFGESRYSVYEVAREFNTDVAFAYFGLMFLVVLKWRNRWSLLFFTYAAIIVTPFLGMILVTASLLMGLYFAAYPFLFLISALLLLINIWPGKPAHLVLFILFGINLSALFFVVLMGLMSI